MSLAQASRSTASTAVPALRRPVVPEPLTTSISSTLYRPVSVRQALDDAGLVRDELLARHLVPEGAVRVG
ncbi:MULTISPECIES: hypothetical protein [Streptomyces]|uniref:hypothetical protein n=1 Tax=Streptomyces TaxID=1883 RepID=UPI0012FE93AA|nr:hypothetical protein [Streptomyces durhamensis]